MALTRKIQVGMVPWKPLIKPWRIRGYHEYMYPDVNQGIGYGTSK